MTSMAEEIQKIHDELNDFIMTDDSENVENLKEALDRTCTELDAFLKKPSALSVDKWVLSAVNSDTFNSIPSSYQH